MSAPQQAASVHHPAWAGRAYLIRRPGDTGELDVQIGIVDVATGRGVAVNLDQLDEVLALVALARQRLGRSGRRWAGRTDHRSPSGRRARTSR